MQQKKRGYQESDAPYLTRLSAMDACGRRSGVNVIRGQKNTAQVQKHSRAREEQFTDEYGGDSHV
ncbi:MAG TPA: hypothetical protein H9757_03610 [Candidatus Mediterraneibacter faecigallinarum]|jgi:hypothetical protein|uniref:Uncharacterized protein n=1 Tax=Candidatus Mediterraneibacter faecigallinarum TaxID=2838669 RepID=A0A9D2SWB4_9FIRM|nr:hypothetical protein [Candidatus Mediterraneibacter faecigallinarum]